MAVAKSLILKEVTDITNRGEIRTNQATFSGTINGINIPLMINLATDRNYNKYNFDKMIVDFMMPLGTFVKQILPDKNKLTVTLTESRGGLIKHTEIYRAILLNGADGMDNKIFNEGDEGSLNVESAYLRVQLIDLHTDSILNTYIRGIVNNEDVKHLLTCTVGYEWLLVQSPGTKFIKTLSITPPHNTRVYDNFVIPPSTTALDFSSYVQSVETGIYKGGAGTYTQKYHKPSPSSGKLSILNTYRTLWFYPLYDVTRPTRKVPRLKVFASNSISHKDVERTYAIDQTSSVNIVAPLSTEIKKPVLSSASNAGSSDIIIAPDELYKRGHDYDDKLVEAKGNYHNKVTTGDMDIKQRRVHRPQDNKYQYISDSMQLNGSLVMVEWLYSVPDILFPGMQVDFTYEKMINGKLTVIKLKGSLQGMDTNISYKDGLSTSMLYLFLYGVV